MINAVKAIFGLILLSGPIYAGAELYSALIILPLSLTFTAAKLLEKGELGILLKGLIGLEPELSFSQALMLLVVTFLTQLVVVTIFFFIAFGVSSAIGKVPGAEQSWLIPIALSSIGVVAGFFIYRNDVSALSNIDSFPTDLMDRLLEMGERDTIMPVEIFSLARDMIDYPDRKMIGRLLEEGYNQNQYNKFQMSVLFNYVRFADREDLGFESINDKILIALDNEARWVSYYAAWAYQTLTPNSEVLNRLKEIATEHPLEDGTGPEQSFIKKVHEIVSAEG